MMKQFYLAAFTYIIAALAGAAGLSAGVIRVPADYSTIQPAIDAAADGDIVLVAPGTYFENLNFLGKAITVRSRKGPSSVTIDAAGMGTVVTFNSGEGPRSKLIGFTLRNGNDFQGGIRCHGSSPCILNNRITQNVADKRGGGIYCLNSTAVIRGNWISENICHKDGGGIALRDSEAAKISGNTLVDNYTQFHGGGIHSKYADPIIQGNLIYGNRVGEQGAGGGIYCNQCAPSIIRNTIVANQVTAQGGGIRCKYADPEITGNLIVANFAGGEGGGIACFSSTSVITNNIIVENYADISGGGIYCMQANPTITNNVFCKNQAGIIGGGLYCVLSYCLISNSVVRGNHAPENPELYAKGNKIRYCNILGGWPGEGNIDLEPLFVEPAAYDYHLATQSPCIDAGDNAAPGLPDQDFDGQDRMLDGNGDGLIFVDIGADEYAE